MSLTESGIYKIKITDTERLHIILMKLDVKEIIGYRAESGESPKAY